MNDNERDAAQYTRECNVFMGELYQWARGSVLDNDTPTVLQSVSDALARATVIMWLSAGEAVGASQDEIIEGLRERIDYHFETVSAADSLPVKGTVQ